MTEINKHGLSRTIPEDVKRQVRQRCGFGCVVCGKALVHYDHFDPEFVDATVHDPAGIILLCDEHHRAKGHFLSKEAIDKNNADPFCRRTGFSRGLPFDLGTLHPVVSIGVITAKNVDVLLRIHNEDVFAISPPEDVGGPFLIDAVFRDATGMPILEIVRNEWRPATSNWDVEIVGGVITIRKAKGNLTLQIRANPPTGLIVERLLMTHRGITISCRPAAPVKFSRFDGTHVVTKEAYIENFERAVSFLSDGTIIVGDGGKAGSYMSASMEITRS